jgi:hypothetical protein
VLPLKKLTVPVGVPPLDVTVAVKTTGVVDPTSTAAGETVSAVAVD